ncbi:MAG TPA: saccharopine dehydrogenase NADP-binding domain-containing protein [Solirubrobacteraceae bacterium]
MSERDLDVVVFGATGVTGRRVAAYLAERATADPKLRWAAAARDETKLERTLAEVGVRAPETIAADISSPPSLTALAARAKVVLDLVGPYTLYGRPMIQACIAEGAHYVDLTGELPFVRQTIADFDGPAKAAGVKIVQVCGFEALPPDLLVALVAAQARERHGEALAAVDVEVTISSPPGLPRPSDGVSGGTFQSLAAVAGAEDAAVITDPAVLVADDAGFAADVRRLSPIPLAPRRSADGAVLAPMAPAAFINPGVIHRSNLLLAQAAGRPPEAFRYREAIALRGGVVSLPVRLAAAGALSATQAGVRSLAHARPALRGSLAGALARFGPSSGFGPAADRLENWGWQMCAIGHTSSGRESVARLEADGHPGYLATARLLGETGILLAEDGATPTVAGCLTPAAALGLQALERFRHARLRFSGES